MKDIASFDEYQRLALRTLVDKGTDMNILHSSMGLSGETGELAELIWGTTPIGTEGEVGDICWYAAVGCHFLVANFSEVVAEARSIAQAEYHSLNTMITDSAKIIEVTKKWLFYGKPIDPIGLRVLYVNYMAGLLVVCDAINVKLEEACFKNINKLAARYPDKFDAERAINRDYEAESKAAGTTIV